MPDISSSIFGVSASLLGDMLQESLSALVDTDFTGCEVARRSTSEDVAMFGSHCLRHWSSIQATLALSLEEAGLTGLCKGPGRGIGMRSIGAGLGIRCDLDRLTGASAAMWMARRLGIGKARHPDSGLLWIQHWVKDRDLSVTKSLGKANPSDALTNPLSGAEIRMHL